MKHGFTLIELLVTTVISVTLLAIFIPAFRTFEEKNKLAQDAQVLRGALFGANAFALAPRQGSSFINCYQVTLASGTDAQEYDLNEITNNGASDSNHPCGTGISTGTVVSRNVLGPGIQIASIAIGNVHDFSSCSLQFGVGARVVYGVKCNKADDGTSSVVIQLRSRRLNESSDATQNTNLDAFVTFNRLTGLVSVQ